MQLGVKQPDVKNLRDLSDKLKIIRRRTFAARYGNILDLLEANVQEKALTALAQFYDPPLRCFTFQDFQLAPTLEEYEQILGYSLGNEGPYLYMGHYPSLPKIASSLNINVRELAKWKDTKGGVEGFPREHLENYAKHLADKEEWDGFMDMLALIIYGIVLFPNIENFIDFAAIDVFLAYKHRRKNPVPAVLADTYHALTLRHEKKGGIILCCLPVLYLWFTTHMFKKGGWVEIRSKSEWARDITNLSGRTISWCSQGLERIDVICHCGDFPNVPLMGTKGYINYNPILALRQFGYPIRNPPTEESVTPFIVYELNQDLEMLHRVRQAWNRVVRKGKGLGVESWMSDKSYSRWLEERVRKIKLPFRSSAPVVEDVPIQPPTSPEEIERLKDALVKFEEEKERLKRELAKARRECQAAQSESVQKMQSAVEANKRARLEEEKKLNTKSCLDAASTELGMRRKERDEARADALKWKKAWEESKVAEKSAQRQLDDLKQQLKMVVAEYKSRVQSEEQLNANLALEHQVTLDEKKKLEDHVMQLNEVIEDYQGQQKLWAHNFVSRALQIKRMLNETSYYLRRAEGMTDPLPTPVEIYEFIEYCKGMISQMRNMASNDE